MTIIIRQEFKRQLDSKDSTIIDLLKQITETKEKVINSDAALEEINAKLDDKETELNLQAKTEKINAAHNSEISRLNEKIDKLQDKITELTEKLYNSDND